MELAAQIIQARMLIGIQNELAALRIVRLRAADTPQKALLFIPYFMILSRVIAHNEIPLYSTCSMAESK